MTIASDFTAAHDLAERLRDYSEPERPLRDEAADLIERLADRVNYLTNANDGLRETLDEQRAGLAELRDMIVTEKSA